MQRLVTAMIGGYSDASYELRERVRYFVYLCIFVIPLLTLFFVYMNVFAQRGLFGILNIVVVGIMAFMILDLFLIRKGYYNVAVDVFVIAVMVGLIFNALSTDTKGSGGRFVASIFAFYMPIFFSILFCNLRTFIAVNLLATAGVAFCTIASKSMEPEVKAIALGSMGITLIITFIIGFLLVRLHETGNKIRQNEAELERLRQTGINEELILSMRTISASLDDSSRELESNSQTFAVNIQSQAASIEEITATMEEISAGSDQVSSVATMQSEAMATLAGMMDELAVITNDMSSKIGETLKRTEQIASKAQTGEEYIIHMDKSMAEVSETSREMSGILNMINDISDRINLLSLNAAIEAARAGDYGRGFAVVADEISKLADQTSTSVKEIATLIKKSDDEVRSGAMGVQETVKLIGEILKGVEDNNRLIAGVNDGMMSYIASNVNAHEEVRKIKSRSDDINNAAREQKNAAEEVVSTITGVNQMSQASAMAADEINSHSKSIAEMANDLKVKIVSIDE